MSSVQKSPKIRSRMRAAHMVRVRGLGIKQAAANLMRFPGHVWMWAGRHDLMSLDALSSLPESRQALKHPARDRGSVARRGSPNRMRAWQTAEARTRAGRQKTTHHVHPKDHACAPPDAKGTTKNLHQQSGQEDRPKLAVSLQKAYFVPRFVWRKNTRG